MSAQAGLSRDWITEPAIDAELKHYVLLAYLQRVKARFDQARLFPHLDDLRDHTDGLSALQRDMTTLREAGPRDAIGLDPRSGQLILSPPMEDPGTLRVITEVIEGSLPPLRSMLEHGHERLEEMTSMVRFEPVGVLPLDLREGYLLVREHREARVYAYALPLLCEAQNEFQHRSLRTRYVTSYTVGITCHYEHIKAELVRVRRELPNPATFVFEAQPPLPCIETCLPLARRMVWSRINRTAD